MVRKVSKVCALLAVMLMCFGCGHTKTSNVGLISFGDLEGKVLSNSANGPTLQGSARLGKLNYRARWIDFESTGDEVLAYTEQNYRSPFLTSGYLVLRLDGRVHWMRKKDFRALLAQQQSKIEIQMTPK